jgi:uncharacterized membrane protein YphA (DoxX/SURF4 family)
MASVLSPASRIVRLSARFVLGGIFIYAGISKIFALREFARVVVNYRILPDRLAVYSAYLLPWVELALGILLISGLYVRASSVVLSVMIVVFMIALAVRSTAGPIKECGCFLSSGINVRHGLAFDLVRDGLLLFVGAFLAWTKQPSGG